MDTRTIKNWQRKLKPLLLPASLIYSSFVNMKEIMYDVGILKSQTYKNTKIVSVGNIVAGGSGKTPVAIELANSLKKLGNTCVITGNYPIKDKRIIIVSSGNRIFKKPPAVPDEAYMIAKKTGVTVIVSKNRKAAVELSCGLNMEYIILDDALHHREIEKSVEICVFGSETEEKEHYLPAGMIRTAKKAMERCDIKICFNEENSVDGCLRAYLKPMGIFDKNHHKKENISSVFIFCGIGNPEKFKETVEKMGINIAGYAYFEDHHIYTKEEIKKLKQKAEEAEAEILLTTYKDFVKMEDEDGIYYLDVAAQIENFDRIIEAIR